MPLHETESLVLRSYNLAEADRIVVFFTRDHGIVRRVDGHAVATPAWHVWAFTEDRTCRAVSYEPWRADKSAVDEVLAQAVRCTLNLNVLPAWG